MTKRLQESLKMAETGVISNCIIVMTGHDGTVVDCWANGSSPFTMVGALETVKKEFMDQIIESRKK